MEVDSDVVSVIRIDTCRLRGAYRLSHHVMPLFLRLTSLTALPRLLIALQIELSVVMDMIHVGLNVVAEP